jgi:uncharacterized membrane protein
VRAYLQQVVYRISGSYWFIPSVMALFAIIFSQLSIQLDHAWGNEWLTETAMVSLNQPDGARALLATVAGSMITVTGVTFSLTILAVSHATSHFGPRLLDNFMHDRGNQITLGTFVATFLYCLLVLRVVRGVGVTEDASPENVFVPQFSLLIALVMTLASIGELIYFIHHVPESIHISTVLQRLSTDMIAKMDDLYPENFGDESDETLTPHDVPFTPHVTITSGRAGYLQGIDDVEMIELANDMDIVIRLTCRPGDFLRSDQGIAEVGLCVQWTDGDADRVRHAFTLGFTRNPTQDVFSIINQLAEIAIRALSPGVNDPYTAMQSIDWLSAGLVTLSKRRLPDRFRCDEAGQVRVITTELNYSDFVDAMVRQLTPYVKDDPNVTAYMVSSLENTIKISRNTGLNRLIQQAVDELRTASAGRQG